MKALLNLAVAQTLFFLPLYLGRLDSLDDVVGCRAVLALDYQIRYLCRRLFKWPL